MLRRASEADPVSGDLLSYVSNNQIQWVAPAAAVDATIDLHSVSVRKAADEVKTTDTTLADDGALVVAVEANNNYIIEGMVFHTAGDATPDIKIAFTVPTAGTLIIGTAVWLEAVGSTVVDAFKHTVSGTSHTWGLTAAQYLLMISGTVTIGANAGNVAFQWAQNTSDAQHTTVELGSWLRVTKI